MLNNVELITFAFCPELNFKNWCKQDDVVDPNKRRQHKIDLKTRRCFVYDKIILWFWTSKENWIQFTLHFWMELTMSKLRFFYELEIVKKFSAGSAWHLQFKSWSDLEDTTAFGKAAICLNNLLVPEKQESKLNAQFWEAQDEAQSLKK